MMGLAPGGIQVPGILPCAGLGQLSRFLQQQVPSHKAILLCLCTPAERDRPLQLSRARGAPEQAAQPGKEPRRSWRPVGWRQIPTQITQHLI